MPGIAGLITKMPRDRAEPILLSMIESMRHEDSYTSGTWIDQALGVYVGWVARRGSFADGMPVCNEQGDVVLVFSGEHYSDPEPVGRLKQPAPTAKTKPAWYLPHLYDEDPEGFAANLNGRFHGILVDRRRLTTMLFNDRYGMSRIYYHDAADSFYFAAEAKALLAALPVLRQPSERGLAEYVSHGCVLENRTIFKDVHVLPPASAWVFPKGETLRKTAYFQPHEWEEQERIAPEPYYHDLKETFARILPRYFAGPEKVAMSLTGGLDTRMIMAWQKFRPGELPCYSFGGMYRDCQDVLLARKVAETANQSHGVITVGREFIEQFPRYLERTVYLTDGCVDAAHSPDLYVNERAASVAPVRMTGNYGGEVLRGVRAFKPGEPVQGLFRPEFLEHVHQARDTYQSLLGGHPLTFAVFKQAPWHHYGLQALEQTQLAMRSPYLDNEFVRTVYRGLATETMTNEIALRLIEDGDPVMRRIRTDFGVAAEHGLIPAALVRRFMTFTFKAEYAYDYGMPQWVAQIDHLFAPLHLERLWLGRHKFYHFRVWYRDALAEYVREMLLDARSRARPYLERKGMETVVEGHLKGSRNYTSEIHRLLSLEMMHRLFFDQK